MSRIDKDRNKRKWAIDLVEHSGQVSRRSTETQLEPFGSSSDKQVDAEDRTASRQQRTITLEIKQKKAWELATSPAKSILMTMFMIWMSGNGVNIFSIMITIYTLINPTKAILGTNSAFEKFEDRSGNLIVPKLIYILINVVILGIAAYKGWVLGLLPTDGDWLAFTNVKQAAEFSGGIIQ